MQGFLVFVLEQNNEFIYSGITQNLEEALCEHRSGLNSKTKNLKDLKIRTIEKYDTLIEAVFRKQILEAKFRKKLA
ncbi:MAG TPA: hypothetical protein ENI23_03910 [bacterium]|nr:hypothetical protein [bacterium]